MNLSTSTFATTTATTYNNIYLTCVRRNNYATVRTVLRNVLLYARPTYSVLKSMYSLQRLARDQARRFGYFTLFPLVTGFFILLPAFPIYYESAIPSIMYHVYAYMYIFEFFVSVITTESSTEIFCFSCFSCIIGHVMDLFLSLCLVRSFFFQTIVPRDSMGCMSIGRNIRCL